MYPSVHPCCSRSPNLSSYHQTFLAQKLTLAINKNINHDNLQKVSKSISRSCWLQAQLLFYETILIEPAKLVICSRKPSPEKHLFLFGKSSKGGGHHFWIHTFQGTFCWCLCLENLYTGGGSHPNPNLLRNFSACVGIFSCPEQLYRSSCRSVGLTGLWNKDITAWSWVSEWVSFSVVS